jgi:hypothetical protein
MREDGKEAGGDGMFRESPGWTMGAGRDSSNLNGMTGIKTGLGGSTAEEAGGCSAGLPRSKGWE